MNLCSAHYKRQLKGKPLDTPLRSNQPLKKCSVDDCERTHEAKGFCSAHLQRHYDGKDLSQPWRGYAINKRINPLGYSMICGPNISKPGQYVLEHRYIMENFLGRKLTKNETVHHKNGIRHDNRLENLELWASSQPSGQRIQDLLEWAYQIVDKYSDEAKKFQGPRQM